MVCDYKYWILVEAPHLYSLSCILFFNPSLILIIQIEIPLHFRRRSITQCLVERLLLFKWEAVPVLKCVQVLAAYSDALSRKNERFFKMLLLNELKVQVVLKLS